ncbi:MAG: hypothetical protein RIF33_01340 [Cyclobacteriaceae bacterium]
MLYEPPYTRPVAPMLKLRRKHTYGGGAYAEASAQACETVCKDGLQGGAPMGLIAHRPSTRL